MGIFLFIAAVMLIMFIEFAVWAKAKEGGEKNYLIAGITATIGLIGIATIVVNFYKRISPVGGVALLCIGIAGLWLSLSMEK